MPAVDTGGAKVKRVARKKPKPRMQPTPDQADRASKPRTPPPPVKERMYAHPGRKEPQKVITRIVADQDEAKAKRAETKAVVHTIHTTPVPSPDAKDSERTPAQKAHDAEVTQQSGQKAHLRAIRKRHRGSGTRAVKRELEGQGVIADLLGKAGEHAVVSTRNPTLSRATTFRTDDNLGTRALKDAFNLPAQVVPSVYVPAAGVVEAAKGHPERLKKFLKDIDKHDAVYNVAAAGVEAAGGDTKSAKKRLKQAEKSASEHPGFAAAEVAGLKGALGRTAGAVMRHAPKLPKVRKAASTTRASRTLPGTSLREDRSYSKDVITKAGQVAVETVQRGRAKRAVKKANKVEATAPDEAVRLRQKAAEINPDRHINEQEIQRRVDEHVDAQETVRRMHRGDVVNEARAMVKGAKGAGPITRLIAEGIVHADVHDIKAYMRELENEYPHLTNAGKRANKQLRRGLDQALAKAAKGKVDLQSLKPVAADYRVSQAAREKALADREMLPEEHAALAAAKPYAVRRMGAKWDDKVGLIDKVGDPLSLKDIHDHMVAHNEPIPSWLSQAPNARGAHNFFQSSSKAPGIHGPARTGEATRGGTFDAHPDTMVEGAAKQQGLIDAFDGFHEFLNEFGIKGAGGKIKTLLTRKQVEQAAREAMFDDHGNPRPGAVKFVPVRVNPFSGRAEQLEQMLDGTDDASMGGAKALTDAVDAALNGGGDGPWALVPEAAAKRLQEHVRVLNPGNAGKVGQKANSLFRKTVLATSLPWLTGNVVEGGMRATLAGAGPRSLITGRRVLKRARELDKTEGERATARTVGGGHFGSAERQHVHLNVDAMNPGKVKKVAQYLGAFWRLGENHPKVPSPAMAASLWHGYTHVVFDTVNRALETQIQTAMLGKALHQSELMDGPLLKASQAAVDAAAHGVLDRSTAAHLGRQIDVMYGKYGKWSPDMRKSIALYTPFVAWTLAASTFVLRTLPRDHPVALALIASTENATDEWRKAHGLDKFIKGAVPAWLQGSIPGPGGTHFRAPGRYTPFGLAGDPLGAYASSVLPMFSGVQAAGHGKDWQGHDLKDQSDWGKAKAAIGAILGSTVPGLATGERLVTKGPKAATLDAVVGKVAPSKKTARRRSSSSSRPGTIVGPGSGGGSIIGSGSSGGRIVR